MATLEYDIMEQAHGGQNPNGPQPINTHDICQVLSHINSKSRIHQFPTVFKAKKYSPMVFVEGQLWRRKGAISLLRLLNILNGC